MIGLTDTETEQIKTNSLAKKADILKTEQIPEMGGFFSFLLVLSLKGISPLLGITRKSAVITWK